MLIRKKYLVVLPLLTGALVSAAPSASRAAERNTGDSTKPFQLTLQPEPDSVYAPPSPPRETEGVNEGGVHFDLAVGYFTDYIFRGIEQFEPPGAEDRANLQVAAELKWDLGKLPHPFIGVFANVAESDPISTFQEIRPIVGAELTLRPFIVAGGYTSYIYPDRDDLETSEVWGRIALDDSYFLRSNRPLLSPYVLFAYDIDLYQGWYFEAGVKHDFPIEDTGLTITATASVAYVHAYGLFAAPDATDPEPDDSGFQHYQIGLLGEYSLNSALNLSKRYGEWSVLGYVYYTDGIEDHLRADTQLWGGMGIGFRY